MICMDPQDEKKLLDTIESLTLIVAKLSIEVSTVNDPRLKTVGLHLTDVDAYGWLTAPG